MGNEKERDQPRSVVLDDVEASSAPRPKGGGDDLALMVAQLRQRAQGLEAHEIEEEIERFLEKLIDRHAKVVPAGLRGEHRALLRTTIEEDPTVRALIADLRRGITEP